MKGLIQGSLILSSFIILCLTFILQITYAETDKQRIYDEAGVLTNEEILNLEAISKSYSEKRQTDFVILTTQNSQSAQQYMANFYDTHQLGYKQKNGNTVILTVNMKNREVYLAGFYQAETYLTNERLDKIRDRITKDLSDTNYARAFETFIKEADYYFDYEPNVNPDNLFYKTWFQFILAIIIALIIVGAMLFQSKSKLTTTSNTYKDMSRSKVLHHKDKFVRRVVTKRYSPMPKAKGPRGGGGGMTGGGHSHSGSSGRF